MVKKLDAFNRAYAILPGDGCGLGNACIYFILPDAEIEVTVQDELIG
ncbi:MAG: hypothetical protein MJZ30_10885 [Paludibacteraceae bacterium]|nr:hypothetical protein [Paludibacteraceae bacterium]